MKNGKLKQIFDKHINNMFLEAQDELNISSGDITPEHQSMIDDFENKFMQIITWQNI